MGHTTEPYTEVQYILRYCGTDRYYRVGLLAHIEWRVATAYTRSERLRTQTIDELEWVPIIVRRDAWGEVIDRQLVHEWEVYVR